MQTKLTLRIDDKVIDKAKKIARGQRKSVSKMVEEHFLNLHSSAEALPKQPVAGWLQQMWDANAQWKKKFRNKKRKQHKTDEDARYEYLKKKYR